MADTSGWVNPIGPGAVPARIDMGVDYTGTYDLRALGSGTITNLYNSGWPGGKFIGLHLDTGQYVYYAENIIIAAGLKIGQKVKAGQKLGTSVNAYPYTEIGWAAAPGTGQTMAAATGQASKGESAGDPGKYSTAYGVNMSDIIKSLGGPAGIISPGGIEGTVSGNYPQTAQLASSTSSAPLSGCIPLIGVVWFVLQHLPKRRRT